MTCQMLSQLSYVYRVTHGEHTAIAVIAVKFAVQNSFV